MIGRQSALFNRHACLLRMPLPRRALAATLLSIGAIASCGGDVSPSMPSVVWAAQLAGLQVAPLQPVGCSSSAVSPEKIEELMLALPQDKRAPLAALLSTTAPAWTVQLYSGNLGMGLCLPSVNVVLVFPGSTPA